MKTTLTSLIIIALLLAGCKKDSSNTTSPIGKNFLLSTITYGYNHNTSIDQYLYDDQKQLIELDMNSKGYIFKFHYDNSGNVILVSVYETQHYTLQQTYKYTYAGNTVTADQVLPDNVTSTGSTYVLTLNDKKQLTKSVSPDGEYVLNTFDANGNVTQTDFFTPTGQLQNSTTFTYDHKQNPMLTVGNIYHLQIVFGSSAFSTNNIVTNSNVSGAYSYLYLDNGLAASASIPSIYGGIQTVNYDYLV